MISIHDQDSEFNLTMVKSPVNVFSSLFYEEFIPTVCPYCRCGNVGFYIWTWNTNYDYLISIKCIDCNNFIWSNV